MNKLYSRDCIRPIYLILLKWVIDTVNMTLLLPPHQDTCFREILSTIPHTKNRIGVDKWHKVLGELRYLPLAFPVSQLLFRYMQEYLIHIQVKRVPLTKGIHQALSDFHWLVKDM